VLKIFLFIFTKSFVFLFLHDIFLHESALQLTFTLFYKRVDSLHALLGE